MNDRPSDSPLRAVVWLTGIAIVMAVIAQWIRPDLPIAGRVSRMVTDVAPFMDNVFDWFRA